MTGQSPPRIRRWSLLLAGLAAVVAVAVLWVTSDLLEKDTPAVRVEMVGRDFKPGTIRVRSTDPRLQVHNGDLYLHDLALPEIDLLVRVPPDETTVVVLDGVAPGTYTLYCTLHSDLSEPDPSLAGMAATLIVD